MEHSEQAGLARRAPKSRLVRTPKRGETSSDDAGSARDELGRYALCDGASQSGLAAQWAELLSRRVTEAGLPPREGLGAWLEPARAAWSAQRADAAAQSKVWYKKTYRDGAATLFALELRDGGAGGEWRFTAAMIGDTCGFHVREGALVGEAMPCRASSDFSMSPECLFSVALAAEPALRFEEGTARAEDVLFLATDALAKWILTELEAGRPPWARLLEIKTDEALRSFADEEREAKRMDEDDVSLLVVMLPPADEGAPRAVEPPEAQPAPVAVSEHPTERETPAAGPARRPRATRTQATQWGDRLVWSVLVPFGVGVLGAGSTIVLVERWYPGMVVTALPASAGPTADASAPPICETAPIPSADRSAQAPPADSPSAAPPPPGKRSFWAWCAGPCMVKQVGDRVSLSAGTPLFDAPGGASSLLLGKGGPFEVRELHLGPGAAPAVMVRIELP